jgi:hypothetical protein
MEKSKKPSNTKLVLFKGMYVYSVIVRVYMMLLTVLFGLLLVAALHENTRNERLWWPINTQQNSRPRKNSQGSTTRKPNAA